MSKEIKAAESPACNCLQESEEKVKKFMTEAILKKNPGSIIAGKYDSGKYENTVFNLSSGDISRRPYMNFVISYTRKKKDGTMETKEKTQHVPITFPYCPFCGKPYATQTEEWKSLENDESNG